MYADYWAWLKLAKEGWEQCPKCGEFVDVYYENPQTGNGLYNCCTCGYAGHLRNFKKMKIRKCHQGRKIHG